MSSASSASRSILNLEKERSLFLFFLTRESICPEMFLASLLMDSRRSFLSCSWARFLSSSTLILSSSTFISDLKRSLACLISPSRFSSRLFTAASISLNFFSVSIRAARSAFSAFSSPCALSLSIFLSILLILLFRLVRSSRSGAVCFLYLALIRAISRSSFFLSLASFFLREPFRRPLILSLLSLMFCVSSFSTFFTMSKEPLSPPFAFSRLFWSSTSSFFREFREPKSSLTSFSLRTASNMMELAPLSNSTVFSRRL